METKNSSSLIHTISIYKHELDITKKEESRLRDINRYLEAKKKERHKRFVADNYQKFY